MRCARRWIKFEEDVEEEGERWSKPHVAALSLHSLLALRSCLSHAALVFNADAPSLETLVGAPCRAAPLLCSALLRDGTGAARTSTSDSDSRLVHFASPLVPRAPLRPQSACN